MVDETDDTNTLDVPADGGERVGAPGATAGTTPEPLDPSAPVGGARFHGTTTREPTAPRSQFIMGPFGRMFRNLQPWVPPGDTDAAKEANIAELAKAMFPATGTPPIDNPRIPAGYTYFGQFVDHDITFDPTSSLTKQNDPNRLHNFRTPRFDLDNLYGEGPADEPFMYQKTDRGKLLIGQGLGVGEHDLPRNAENTALIGDKRNDENIIVSQLQLAFLKFHNAVYELVTANLGLTGSLAFTHAQELVRWHYQYVVLFDFLKRLLGDDLWAFYFGTGGNPDPFDIRKKLRFYRPKEISFMPVEFSVAAYRLGHSMVRGGYRLNSFVSVPIFSGDPDPDTLADLRGFRILPEKWTIDWGLYVDLDRPGLQPSLMMDSKLAGALALIQPEKESLALLNLLRGFRMGLPSGQAVARAMWQVPKSNAELGVDPAIAGPEAPLWFYILKEAELDADGGKHLGAVGGRIVAEVFLGLALGDPNCFLNVDPLWTPARGLDGSPLPGADGDDFQLRDIFKVAGVDQPF